MKADGKGWLYAPSGLVDGPLPAHYEPYESPVANAVYRQQSNPAALVWEVPGNPYAPVGSPEYPHVLSTYRLTEHHLSGTMSRWLPWLAELQPELFCEISPEHADEIGVKNTDWVVIATPRGSIRAKALDLLRGVDRVLGGHDDGRAQPRLAVEPLRHQPVVDRAAQRLRQVLAVHRLAAMQAVDDGEPAAEAVQRLPLQQREIGAGLAFHRPPVGAAGQRRTRGIARELQPIGPAGGDHLPPRLGHVRQQGAHAGHRHMHVAVDRPWRHADAALHGGALHHLGHSSPLAWVFSLCRSETRPGRDVEAARARLNTSAASPARADRHRPG